TPWGMAADNADDVTDLAVQGETLFLMTHKHAPRFLVVRTALSNPDFAHAEIVVPAGEAVITGIAAASDGLYVRKLHGGNSELHRLPPDGERPAAEQLAGVR